MNAPALIEPTLEQLATEINAAHVEAQAFSSQAVERALAAGDLMTGVEIQGSALGQQLAGLTTAVYSGKNDLELVKRRMERMEQRLDTHEAA